MPASKASLVVLKIGNGGAPETFTAMGGARLVEMTLARRALDASNRADGAWRVLRDGAGNRALSVTLEGIFTDSASEETLRALAFSGGVRNCELHFGNGDKLTAPFQVTEYERGGGMTGAENFRATLESAGAITYTAV